MSCPDARGVAQECHRLAMFPLLGPFQGSGYVGSRLSACFRFLPWPPNQKNVAAGTNPPNHFCRCLTIYSKFGMLSDPGWFELQPLVGSVTNRPVKGDKQGLKKGHELKTVYFSVVYHPLVASPHSSRHSPRMKKRTPEPRHIPQRPKGSRRPSQHSHLTRRVNPSNYEMWCLSRPFAGSQVDRTLAARRTALAGRLRFRLRRDCREPNGLLAAPSVFSSVVGVGACQAVPGAVCAHQT